MRTQRVEEIKMKFKLGSAKPKFAYYLWHWTAATESLFDLTKDELRTFKLLVDEASK